MKTAIIKTDFWEDDGIFELNSDTRLFYLCLLTNPKREVVPAFKVSDRMMSVYSGYSRDLIEICRRQLLAAGMILYEDDFYILTDQDYIKPSIGRDTPKIYQREFDKLPVKIQQIITKMTTVNSSGSSTGASTGTTSGVININITNKHNKQENTNDDINEIYNFFIESYKRNQNQYKLTPTRIGKIKARLKDAGKEMIMLAIEKSSKTPFYTGLNDRKWKADLDFILRSYEKVEQLSNLEVSGKFLKYDNTPKKPQPKPIEREQDTVKLSPEEAEKNRVILDLVRQKKYTFSEMKTLKSKSLAELRAL